MDVSLYSMETLDGCPCGLQVPSEKCVFQTWKKAVREKDTQREREREREDRRMNTLLPFPHPPTPPHTHLGIFNPVLCRLSSYRRLEVLCTRITHLFIMEAFYPNLLSNSLKVLLWPTAPHPQPTSIHHFHIDNPPLHHVSLSHHIPGLSARYSHLTAKIVVTTERLQDTHTRWKYTRAATTSYYQIVKLYSYY